ncbi:MAG: helix-turn-helix domain-containing protein [Prevotella copri]|nr:helix-turn-helix domain-containing protein [Segatella copri]
MKHQQIYNLEEFANKYQLTDIFGAYAAYFSVGFTQPTGVDVLNHFKEMVQQRTLFTKLLLIRKGTATVVINEQDERKTLNADSLLVMTSRHVINEIELTPDFEAECVLVDTDMVDENTIYHLTEEKHKSVSDVFNIIHNIVRHQHINKVEMIQSMFNVLRLILEELPYEERSISHDFKHKKEVYEIFLHHLYRNFRKERQIRFYASNMNVSTAYLSRLVKEISGSTINEHVTSLIYKEACNLLSHSDMSIGEIADALSFSDQSALTNFFKMRAGMTPLAYRTKGLERR